jgi:hypothetical protein
MPSDVEASADKINTSLSALTQLASLLEKKSADFPWIGKQSQRLVSLQKDLSERYSRLFR